MHIDYQNENELPSIDEVEKAIDKLKNNRVRYPDLIALMLKL